MQGRLIIGAMPIGDIDDISIRMLNEFKSCDVIYSDQGHDQLNKILKKHSISKKIIVLKSFWSDYADPDQLDEVMSLVESGKQVMLVAGEGQVAIADPGLQFITKCIRLGHSYTVIPGPNAFVTAYLHTGYKNSVWTVHESISHNTEEILKGYANSTNPVIMHIKFDKLKETLEALAKHYHPDNLLKHVNDNRKVVTVCCNMTYPDEFIIRDYANDLINNKDIKKINDRTQITIAISGFLGEGEKWLFDEEK